VTASVALRPSPAVFVVDDDAIQRLLLTAVLTKGGYRVAQASDGAEALQRIINGEECALVVTDLHMPNLDGAALIQRLRADPRTATLPIVVLSGSDRIDRELQLRALGANDYIRKPVDPPRLLDSVRAMLRHAA
jgi:CheY-like chemotaxis protein